MKKRVLIFGEKECGKTSIIELIANSQTVYSTDFANETGGTLNFSQTICDGWVYVETSGLSIGDESKYPFDKKAENQKDLLFKNAAQDVAKFTLLNRDGFSILILVKKSGTNLTQKDLINYKYFFEDIGKKSLPILFVITHCDPQDTKDQIKKKNKQLLEDIKKLNNSKQILDDSNIILACTISKMKMNNIYVNNRQAYITKRRESQLIIKEKLLMYDDKNTIQLIKETVYHDLMSTITRFSKELHEEFNNYLSNFVKNDFNDYVKQLSLETIESVQSSNFNKKRILVVGETGHGKSSLIKLITGNKNIVTSSGAKGCTFKSKYWETPEFVFIDTIGLQEGPHGTVPNDEAVFKTIKFIQSNKEGFSLMVFVFKAGRLTKNDDLNYELFYKVINRGEIPVVLIITHCETFKPMSVWWDNNRTAFKDQYDMQFNDCLCACTFDEDTEDLEENFKLMYKNKRETSKKDIQELLAKYAITEPVRLYAEDWGDIVGSIFREWARGKEFNVDAVITPLESVLLKSGLEPEDVEKLAQKVRLQCMKEKIEESLSQLKIKS